MFVEVDQSDPRTLQRCKVVARAFFMLRIEDARQRSHCGITSNMSDTPLRACVDGGHGCGKETIVAELLAFLSAKSEMKHVHKIWKGSCEALENFESARRTEIDQHPERELPPICVGIGLVS